LTDSILIGVGSVEAQTLAVNVLSYSLMRHTTRPLEIVPLWRSGIEVPTPRDSRNAPRTPFSFQRFLLPELGGFRRRSIYLDSDMLALTDIGELFDTPIEEGEVLAVEATPGRKPVYSVLLIDPGCGWRVGDMIERLDSGEQSYEALMFDFEVPGRVDVRLPWRWNSLETYEKDSTAILHYTDMWLQPWLVKGNPLAAIWGEYMLGALAHGFAQPRDVAEAVRRKWVRPSLLYQAEQGIADPGQIPWRVGIRDAPFTRYCRKRSFRIF